MIEFSDVTPERWPDFERLFEGRGGPKYCWCMVWRSTTAELKHHDSAGRKSQMSARIAAGIPVGLLGYHDGEPVAWCSIAPRSTYQRLANDGTSDEGIWSIACFFVHRRFRGQGLMRQLLDAAIAHARAGGARIVEGYPVDPDSPSYRFMGFVPLFEMTGFQEVGRAGSRRHVMRLDVRE